MPEILVKIGAAISKDEEYQVALEIQADSKSSTRAYLALSYCWGGDQIHKTTRCQVEATDFGLDWTALPASIQDAIKVTANLGFDYLWVDSLCIIQDDPVQKARQMAQMCEVYENAALTIRACKARRAVDGFLRPIDLEDVFDMAVKLPYRMIFPPDLDWLQYPDEFSYEELVEYLTWSLDDKFAESEEFTGSIYIGCVSNQKLRDNDQSYEFSRYELEPIDLRAWTLQERYLSARNLDFCRRQIRWRCPTRNKCHPPEHRRLATSIGRPKSGNHPHHRCKALEPPLGDVGQVLQARYRVYGTRAQRSRRSHPGNFRDRREVPVTFRG